LNPAGFAIKRRRHDELTPIGRRIGSPRLAGEALTPSTRRRNAAALAPLNAESLGAHVVVVAKGVNWPLCAPHPTSGASSVQFA